MAYKAGLSSLTKSDLWDGGLSCVGKISSCMTTGQRVSEEWSRPSSAPTLDGVVMGLC
jgi:hypothetical protein